jgi:pyruvate formate lyase activating enzyme
MGRCHLCRGEWPVVSEPLGLCAPCIRAAPELALPLAHRVHAESRRGFGLAASPPRYEGGVQCRLCANECVMGEGETGYCGARSNRAGRLSGGCGGSAKVSWYHDPLPTNCVASWVCPAETDAGYPAFTHTRGPEYGFFNLAVFYEACSFDCLFCQNWHFRQSARRAADRGAGEIAEAVNSRTSCICHFGGDPGPQLPHALRASRLARRRAGDRILRICWESNGSMHPRLLDQMAALSLGSGGCIKFDLKAWDDNLHRALTGMSNRRTLSNFARLAESIPRRPEPPLLVASTLLVPGYVDEQEVSALAAFIASLDPSIPYSLLAFHPQFYMRDLPPTSRAHAERCEAAARAAGLTRVKVANLHVLGEDYGTNTARPA